MCVHNAEHDFKYAVFEVIVYVKYEFKFLNGRCSVGWWSVARLVDGRW